MSKAYELEDYIQRSEGPFLEVLFSGGIFRHNRLRTGAIWEVSWTNRRPNDKKKQERMNEVKETVFLFKFLFPKKLAFPCERQTPYLQQFIGNDPANLIQNKKESSQSEFKGNKPPPFNFVNMGDELKREKKDIKVPGLNLPNMQNGIDKLEFRLSVERGEISEDDGDGESYDDFDEHVEPQVNRNAGLVPNLNFGGGGNGGKPGLSLNLGELFEIMF